MPRRKTELNDYPPLPSEDPQRSKPSQGCIVVIVAIIGAVSTILAAWISGTQNAEIGRLRGEEAAEQRLLPTIAVLETSVASFSLLPSQPDAITNTDTQNPQFNGHVDGILTDRSGVPIPDMKISIQNGSQTETDSQGRFVFDHVPPGSQLIIVQATAGGEFSQNIEVEEDQITSVNLVFDPQTTRLGLLTIVSPVDGGGMEIRTDIVDNSTTVHRATIYGRCDGLRQIFGNGFDVWVLIHSERDSLYWVQQPAATVDFQDNTWRADVVLGNLEHPPVNGERWTIIAMAAEPDTEFYRIINTPNLNLLPPHIASNVITVESQIE